MATPSINIGIGNKGKELIQSIDHHFKTHELDLSKAILSAGVTSKEDKYCFQHIQNNTFVEYETEHIISWFNSALYPEINNLSAIADGNVDYLTNVNIIVQIEEVHTIDILKELLNAIETLIQRQSVGVLSVRLFTVIHPLHKNSLESQDLIAKQLLELKQVTNNFESLLREVYYIDNQNVDAVHLRLESKWLGFALAEFFVLKMIGPTSMAITGKNKILGLGVIHFNEGLFREIILNKILEYKFKEEAVDDTTGVQLQDVYDKCNPFIRGHQDFFQKFINEFPSSKENENTLEENTNNYISNFKQSLNAFITDVKNNIGESKAILANLLGEDDEKLEGIDWKGERLNLKDLEFDIINYFNQFLEGKDQVDLVKEKYLREQITDLKNGIKKGKQSIEKIDEISNEINSDLDISFEEGIFSIDGKRINAAGYIPSPIDPNDEVYSFKDEPISKNVDLATYLTPIKDQGQLGSCTAFPIAAVYEFAANQNNKPTNVSELFIYYNARVLRGNTEEDSGATLLEAINGVKEKGACLTDVYPYDIKNFKNVPSDNAFVQAKHQVVEKACRVKIAEKDFKHAIANGYPIIFGLKLFQSFYPKNTSGIIKYPTTKEAINTKHGNHAMLIVGYNDDEKLFKVRNSWGSKFGDNGYCYIPYDYASNPEFCQEAFVITKIVDLAYNQFEYDSKASFSFLKDKLIRKKTITEYNIRAKKKALVQINNEYQEVALQNEENTEQIKDSLFRKNLLKSLSSEIPIPKETSPVLQIPKTNLKKWYYIFGGGVFLLLISLLFTFIFPIVTILGALISIGLIIWSVINIKNLKQKNQIKEATVIHPESNSNASTKDLYIFRVADRLFDKFEEMDTDLITRYRALSKYYLKVQKWREENLKSLSKIDYSSPNFVSNVIEKKPLMTYLENQKEVFLRRLPNLSSVFHEKYDAKFDNTEDVFVELKENYWKDIQKNTDAILDVSIAEYLLGKKYPYFNTPPELNRILPKLEKVSKPFCNLKSTAVNIESQHYVLMEKIISDKNQVLDNFSVHINPNITPVIVERKNNRKKYVSIQVANIESVESIVRFVKKS
jgi:C1A family cysteine protease